ncbi:MAG: hypothetical protein ABEJ93_00800 [Candidatus Nanohalobium sp.]
MDFPYSLFFIVINTSVWIAEAYLDISNKEIQPLYAYPILLILVFLPLTTIAVTAAPLIFAPILYYTGVLSEDDATLLALYILSTAPYLEYAVPILLITGIPYVLTVQLTGLKDEIATAPAATTSIILTYIAAIAL